MANPTTKWDKVPIFGWFFELDGTTPKAGQIKLTLAQRVNSVDGRNIFPGGTVSVTLGGTDNDTTVMNQIRNAMRTADQNAVVAGGGTFDGAAWDADWDARVPAAFFTSFPASDDPDIVQSGFQVKVEEKLVSGDGKVYYVTPLLSMLSTTIPGLNVGTVDVPPGSPTAPAPIYQKGAPGGVASLDATGLVPTAQLPAGLGGGGAVDSVNGQVGVVSLTSADIGLGNVDNTADVDKPVSTAQASALAGKADLSAVPAIGDATGDAADGGLTLSRLSVKANTADVVPNTRRVNGKPLSADVSLVASDVAAVPTTRTVAGKALSADVSLVKADVGLSNVDNTSDANKPLSTASQNALASRLNMRGDYVSGSVYAVNDVVNSPGYGRWRCIQAHTSSGPGPNVESAYWTILGGNSNVVVGTQPGNAADAATVALKTTTINGKALSANITLTPADTGALASGYAGAVTGTRFTVLYVSGSGWPARPTTRTDVYVDWIDTTGTAGTTTPAGIVTGDQIIQLTSSGVTSVTYRSSSVVGPNQQINYLTTPLQLPAPAGLAVGDYYMVAVLFGSLPFGSSFVAPSGFARLTPAGASGQDFAVFGYKMATSADVTAVATSNWSPNTATVTRGQAIGVALQGVASVGTPTAITYANPITSPWTPAAVTGDATFQVFYTGATSTSTHAVHASVGGTLLAQVMAESGTPDPQSDNVLSISMNGTGVSWSPSAIYGGGTNIPVTKG